MTREEAKAFIEEAERLPASQVDPEKLAEAIEVLGDPVVDYTPVIEALKALGDAFSDTKKVRLGKGEGGAVSSLLKALGEAVGEVVGKVAGVAEPFLEDVGHIQTAGPRFENAEWLARAVNLAERATDPTAGPVADSELAGGRPAAPQAGSSDTGGPFGVQFNRRLRPDTAGVDRLDPAFRKRLTEAAAGADVSPEEVEALIGQGMTYLAQVKEAGFALPPDSPTTIEQYLETYIEKWEAAGPRPIGVPFDFVASKEVRVGLGATREGDPTETRTTPPQYFEGDELAPASLDPAVIIHLQKRLVAAGLLDEGDYYAGYWTDVTAAAYYKVLANANTNGTTPTVALSELIRTLPQSIKDQRAEAKRRKTFQAPPFLKPDYNTMAQRVKSVFRTDLRREPTDAEMAELTRVMSGVYRQDFDAEVALMRSQFDAQQEGLATGVPVAAADVVDVDPAARFQELFERRFKPEIDRLGSLDEVRRNTTNVFASLRTMSSLVGGGR